MLNKTFMSGLWPNPIEHQAQTRLSAAAIKLWLSNAKKLTKNLFLQKLNILQNQTCLGTNQSCILERGNQGLSDCQLNELGHKWWICLKEPQSYLQNPTLLEYLNLDNTGEFLLPSYLGATLFSSK